MPVRPEQQVRRDLKAIRDHKEMLGLKGLSVPSVRKVRKGCQVKLDPKVPKAIRERQERPDHKVRKATRVQ